MAFIVRPLVPTAYLRGQVLDSLGNPLPGIPVLAANDSWIGQVISGPGGQFEIGVNAGTWGLGLDPSTANVLGLMVASNFMTNTVQAGVDLNGLSLIAFRPTARIHGSITDEAGHTIVNVVLAGTANIGGNQFSIQGATDVNGQFDLAAMPGNWSVAPAGVFLNSRGFQCLSLQDLTVSGNEAPVDFVAHGLNGNGLSPILRSLTVPLTGQMSWRLQSQTANSYRIETSLDLDHWTPILTNFTAFGSFNFLNPDDGAHSQRFFRVKLIP